MKGVLQALHSLHGQALAILDECAANPCIALLLGGEAGESGQPPAPELPVLPVGLDMESRIDNLFRSLNADALRFQDDFYRERRHIGELDQHRCASYEEISGGPPVAAPLAPPAAA